MPDPRDSGRAAASEPTREWGADRGTAADRGSAPAAAVGVLFVHGIGTQSRGGTLAAFATPVAACLTAWYDALHDRWAAHGLRFEDAEAWLDQHDAGDPRLVDALRSLLDRLPRRAPGEAPADLVELSAQLGDTLAAAVRLVDQDAGEDAPGCARLEITRIAVGGGARRTSWLLAESWWAQSFAAPSFADLARWGIGIIARTIGSHFGVRVRRAIDRVHQRRSAPHVVGLAIAAGQLLLAVYASLLALAGLGLLLLLGALPIPQLRAGITRLQLALASSVGDSYVLVTQPVQAAAIVGRVRRDLGWLADRAGALAVVAHSQGAAVINEVLREELAETDPARRVLPDPASPPRPGAAPRGQLRQLLTLGSGLRKLDELRRLLGPHKHFRRSALLTVAGVVLFSLATLGLAVEDARAGQEWTGIALLAGYAAVGLGLLATGMADMVTGPGAKELEWWAGRLQRTGIAWTDYAASADPVPNGRLFSDDASFPQHVTIRNRGSLTADHTTYWSNVEEFVTDLLARLSRLDPEIAADIDSHHELLAFARRRRRWRVSWLVATRLAAALATLVVVARTSGVWLPELADGLRRLLALAGIGAPGPQVEFARVLAALGPAVAVVAAYVIAAAVWRAWDAHEGRQLLARRRPGSGSVDVWFLGAATGVAVTAVAAAVPGVAVGPRWPVATFFGLMVVWFITQLAARAFAGSGDAAGGSPATRAEAFASRAWNLGSFGAMLLSWVLLGGIAWRWLSRWPLAGVVVIAVVSVLAIISLARAWMRRRAAAHRGG